MCTALRGACVKPDRCWSASGGGDARLAIRAPPPARSSGRRSTRRLQVHAIQRFQIDDVAVLAPDNRQPKGIIHFLGGAFAGAAPALVYSLLLERLAAGGYTVVATPYAVTFQHEAAARSVHSALGATLARLQSARSSAWAAPPLSPVHGLGHSNGALLHLLIGSLLRPVNASNVIVSYNNRQVSDAVPLPLGALQPAVAGLRGGDTLAAAAQRATQQAVSQLVQLGRTAGMEEEGLLGTLRQLDPALVQLGSVFDEVGDGLSDFTPSPSEARQLIGSSYSVPQVVCVNIQTHPCLQTLLVRFADDGIDQTPEMEQLLQQRAPEGTVGITLPGTHVTPCGADFGWEVRGSFGPADALGMAAKQLIQADSQRLADRVLAWLDSRSTPPRR